MAWRLAQSLEVLRREVNVAAPRRSKAADGTIGDTSHAASLSDHNPNGVGVVCAFDITHDPAHGADCGAWSAVVIRHPAFKYAIFNRRIYSRSRASEGWRPYAGSNPHSSHMHVSVGVGSDGRSTGPYDDASPWGIAHTEEDDELGFTEAQLRVIIRSEINGTVPHLVDEQLDQHGLGKDDADVGTDPSWADRLVARVVAALKA